MLSLPKMYALSHYFIYSFDLYLWIQWRVYEAFFKNIVNCLWVFVDYQGIKTLGTIGLKDTDVECSREALRCVANAMLLAADARQIFIDHVDFVKDTCAKYEVRWKHCTKTKISILK